MSFEWAKLVSLNPEKPTIHFFSSQNSTKREYVIEDLWKIYQDNENCIWIENLSSSYYIKVEKSYLIKNERKRLQGGERFAFDQKQKNPERQNPIPFDYMLNLGNPKSVIHLGRSRSLGSPQIATPSPKAQEKALKPRNDLHEELACSICRGTFYKCVTINPCQHNFCSGCLSETLNHSLKCPFCRESIHSVKKNPLLNTLIELTCRNYPQVQRPKSECLLLDSKDRISKGYNIIRDKLGTYVGYTLNNKREGRGSLTYTNGSIYEGMWKADKKEGKGKIVCQNGTIYEGTWVNDVMQPMAVIKCSNGDLYRGETSQYKAHGKGVFAYRNGDVFHGNFINGVVEGFGTYTWRNGSVYTGNWVRGMKSGDGTLECVHPRGVYVGDWKNNKMEGEGAWTQENGDIFTGKWLNGILQAPANIYYNSGQTYEGEVQNFKRHGRGSISLQNGDICKGLWIQDVLQRQVTINYADGSKYEGEIDNEASLKRNGKGVLTMPNGETHNGVWRNNEIVNE